MYVFECPICHSPLSAEEDDIHTTIECAHCSHSMFLTPELLSALQLKTSGSTRFANTSPFSRVLIAAALLSVFLSTLYVINELLPHSGETTTAPPGGAGGVELSISTNPGTEETQPPGGHTSRGSGPEPGGFESLPTDKTVGAVSEDIVVSEDAAKKLVRNITDKSVMIVYKDSNLDRARSMAIKLRHIITESSPELRVDVIPPAEYDQNGLHRVIIHQFASHDDAELDRSRIFNLVRSTLGIDSERHIVVEKPYQTRPSNYN